MLKRLLSAGLVALAGGILASSACDQVEVVVVDAASVEVSPGSITIEIDERTKLQVVVRDATGTVLTGRTVLWSSSRPSVAAVDVNGEVLGIEVGVVTITARSGGAVGVAQVIVESPPGFSLDRTVVNLSAATGAIAGPETVLISGTGASPTTGLVASIQYTPGEPGGWLQVGLSGTRTPASLAISGSTQGLAPGVYHADVVVSADRVPSQGIAVTLTVSQPPTIGLSPTSASFSAPAGGANPPSQVIAVSNRGSGDVTGLQAIVSYGAGQPIGWLTAVLAGTQAPTDLTLSAAVGSLPQGTYTASVSVSSPDAANSPQIVPVTFVVGASLPSISLSTNSASFSTTTGGPNPPSQSVAVTNGGGGTLDQLTATVAYQGAQTGWLSASLGATAAPTTLTLTVDATGLPVGSHSATVSIASPSANNSPQLVNVQFTVGPQTATIGLSPASVQFSAYQGGPNPSGQSVSVTNTGGGTLDQLSTSIVYQGASSGWLTAPLAGTTAPTTVDLTATTAGLPQGTHTATVSVASANPGVTNSPQTISVQFTVGPPPVIDFTPDDDVTMNGFTGGPAVVDASVTVVNAGGGGANALTGLSVSSSDVWVSATVGPTSPATLTITADPSGLAQGTYNATLIVSSTTPGVGSDNVDVTFVVGPPPTIALSQTSLAMNGLESPGLPLGESRQVHVTNGTSGGGVNDLTGLGATINYQQVETGWLAATWNTTTSPATLTLTTDAHRTNLPPGDYDADVDVTSVLATNSPQTISVRFRVDKAPAISLNPSSLGSFAGVLSTGTVIPPRDTVNITNSGGGTPSSITGLSVTVTNLVPGAVGTPGICNALANDTAWVGATLAQTTTPADLIIAPSTAPLAATGPGSYCARIRFFSPVAKNSGGPDVIAILHLSP